MKKLIEESELKRLLADSELLARLDAAGVDNWIGYGEALSENIDYGKPYEDWLEIDLDDLVKKYQDYTIIDDNYNFD